MKLESIEISGFRGIQRLELDFTEQINVLVGVNGAGKSAILDCTAIMLSRLTGRIRSSAGTGRYFTESDIKNDVPTTLNRVRVFSQGKSVQWSVSKTRRGRQPQKISELIELRKQADLIRSKLEQDDSATLPLAIYYPVHRAVLDIPLRIRKRHQFDQLAAYDQALSGSSGSFRIFFEWFREREDLENERRLDNRRFRDPQLGAVRSAVERFLPGFKGLKVRRSPLRMVVKKNGEELIINQLSDGEKCTLAMVGDLARRMAIANPKTNYPLEGNAVVLIDEIDLHLHPAWQRNVVPAFMETFPQCQFLLTTHSPQILSHLNSENIWILKKTRSGVRAMRPVQAFGQTSGRILEDIMDVSERPEEVRKELTKLFRAIEEKKLMKAKHLLAELKDRIGLEPDLVKADVLIHRQEILDK